MKSRKKRISRMYITISYIMVFILCVTSVLVYAKPSEKSKPKKDDKEVTIVEEDITLRGEYEKHFINSDGTYTAVVYAEPVHMKENGKWEEIDNTLINHKDVHGNVLKNKDGVVDVSFADDDMSESLVSINKDGYSISWNVNAEENNQVQNNNKNNNIDNYSKKIYSMSGNKNANVKKHNISNFSENEKKMFAEKLESSIVYEGLFDSNIDIEYTLSSNYVKEDIILNQPTNITTFTMDLSVNNLIPRLHNDNSIGFYNSNGKEIFFMPAPFMIDTADAYSEDIQVELVKAGNGYVLKLTPNKEWLNADIRKYPITIDPSVSPSNEYTNVKDTYVVYGESGKHNNDTTMYVGLRNNKINRAYIRFTTMPTIKGLITEANMNITAVSGTNTFGNLRIYQVNSSWDSGSITWVNQPTSVTLIADGIRTGNNISFDVLSAVKKWYSGSYTGSNANYGFSIRYSNEAYKDYNRFYTSESASGKPVLNIVYVPAINVSSVSISRSSAQMAIGEKITLSTTITPLNATNKDIIWSSSNNNIATVSSNGVITAKKKGTVHITATTVDGGKKSSCYVVVTDYSISSVGKKVFQTKRTPGYDENGKKARDFIVGGLSRSDLLNINMNLSDIAYIYDLPPVSSSVLPPQGPEALYRCMRQLPDIFCISDSEMGKVVEKMIEKFIEGSGGEFRDGILTDRVKNHTNTKKYIDTVKENIINYLKNNNGNVDMLMKDDKFVAAMQDIKRLNFSNDFFNGLKIAINDTWGNYIEIKNYTCDGKNYSGTIRFTIYDHFGLDVSDVSSTESGWYSTFLGYTSEFGSWLVLQRYNGCNGKHKPFVTYIEFEESFSGTIN